MDYAVDEKIPKTNFVKLFSECHSYQLGYCNTSATILIILHKIDADL